MIDRSGYTPETLARLHRLREAESCLSDYREPSARASIAEGRRLMQLMDSGWSPADAAERVQAEGYSAAPEDQRS